MTTVSTDDAITQLLAVLAEAFEGPQQKWSYFTDHAAESGLFGTLANVSASDASRVWAGSTIAAHAHHASFALDASAAWIAGDHSPRNWNESWSVHVVDDGAWKQLRQALRDGYHALRRVIDERGSKDADSFGGSVAAIAHAAYHLGAVRQKVAASRKG